jgi:hypothetical protein
MARQRPGGRLGPRKRNSGPLANSGGFFAVGETPVDRNLEQPIMRLAITRGCQGRKNPSEDSTMFDQAASRGICARSQAMIREAGEQGRAASSDAS